MSYSRTTKKKTDHLFLWLYYVVFTPLMFHFADLERGYNSLGGEIFVPFIPILLMVIRSERIEEND